MKLGYPKVLWEYSNKCSTKSFCVKGLNLVLCPKPLCEPHYKQSCLPPCSSLHCGLGRKGLYTMYPTVTPMFVCLSNSHSSCFPGNIVELTCYSRGQQCQIHVFPDSSSVRNIHLPKNIQFCQKETSDGIWGKLLGKILLPYKKRETRKNDSLATLVASFFLMWLWCL